MLLTLLYLVLAGLILWSFCYIIARIVRSFRGKRRLFLQRKKHPADAADADAADRTPAKRATPPVPNPKTAAQPF